MMKPKSSPLEIHDFAITQMDFKFIPPEKVEDMSSQFKSYDIEIDFGVTSNDFLMVYVKASINTGENRKPGYSLTAEATCVFELHTEAFTLDNSLKESLEGYSTIYIALNSLRGLISNFTANAPFGRYILPSLDLNDLIARKKAEVNKNFQTPSKKKKTTKKSISEK